MKYRVGDYLDEPDITEDIVFENENDCKQFAEQVKKGQAWHNEKDPAVLRKREENRKKLKMMMKKFG